MFTLKNRAIQMTLVKTDDDPTTPDSIEPTPTIDLELLDSMLTEKIKLAAIAIVGVVTAITVVKTASEVVINNTNPANR